MRSMVGKPPSAALPDTGGSASFAFTESESLMVGVSLIRLRIRSAEAWAI